MLRISLPLLTLLFSAQLLFAQETIVTIKLEGKLAGKDFIQTNFAEQAYQSTEIESGQLRESLEKPTQISFVHVKGSGKILVQKAFWLGPGEYTITGSIQDLSTLQIDSLHEYDKISREIGASEGDSRKELILENLDKEVGVMWFIRSKELFNQNEINQAALRMSDEMKALNSFKRFMAEGKLEQEVKIAEGERSPAFTLESREGPQVSLTDYEGKYRLLEFSFTGCKPCLEALPEIKEIHDRFGEELVVISVWNDRSKDTWLNTAKKHKALITWTDLWDEAGYVTKLYQVNVWPTYMLIDPDGQIEQIWTSYWKGRILRKIENLLSEP